MKRADLCNLDHNGECLVCDCWISDCAFRRLKEEDYTYESREELLDMFKNVLNEENFTPEELSKILRY